MKNNFFKFSKKELIDLGKAWIAISFAFAIVIQGFSFTTEFLSALLISSITVGLGFLLHELAHKFLAQKYGCIAEFRSNDKWLIIAIFMSFLGFIFAAPGGVAIQGHIDKIRYGRISAAGIIANMVLALSFLILFILTPLRQIAFYGLFINSLLAIFNLIPIWGFDGHKILKWNKKIYGIMIVAAITLIIIQIFIGTII